MVWTIEITARARKSINNLDKQTAIRILSFLSDRLAANENPRQLGKQLTGPLKHYWSYRVGDYRLLCEIIDKQLIKSTAEIKRQSGCGSSAEQTKRAAQRGPP